MPAAVVLVRHGETEWSISGRHTSRTDLPLTEQGRKRAALLASELRADTYSLVLCSPLRRARETCELAGFADRAVIVDDLREWDYGDYEGLTTAQIRERDPTWNLWHDGCPGGEQPAQVSARADRALARVAGGEGDVIVFAHGHLLRVLAARWIGEQAAFGARLALSAGAHCRLAFERETPVLDRWNVSDT